jgi:hypothetical protein
VRPRYMGKIPSYLNPPDNPDLLTDLVLYEWSTLGLHLNDVHDWACRGPEHSDGLTERVDYLLEATDMMIGMDGTLHPEVVKWCSIARMILNCINGGSTPRRFKIYDDEVL